MTNSDDKTSSALDRALEMTFPASDPIAVYMPEERTVDEEPVRQHPRRSVSEYQRS